MLSDVASQLIPSCGRCGAPMVPQRRRLAGDSCSSSQATGAGAVNAAEAVLGRLCSRCRQRLRRAEYFRTYYESNRDRILVKNRRWAKDNRDKLVELRQARRAARTAQKHYCVDCGAEVARATRCRRCSIRFRYANEPSFRERRLSITRRWLDRRAETAPAIS